ncbi:cystathionine gamma-lyase [Granulicella aggregans]|uniref:Cystathionine gamma-lyase n=1 Tax=Granulicella aggregans TaxID=474949 RepID=A0A7W7ZBW4_9BACT|nr:cystathionine gamma-lyase [Granulicella aggregans]MBB5056774.1 cystathionine gamma-lyase [Granulicella aggregans]
MRDATRIIRSTLTPVATGEPIHHGPVFAAPFHTPGDPEEGAYTYARDHNPTWTAVESALAGMESGDGYTAKALVYGSGMAAISAVFSAVLEPGDVAVLPSDCYFGARALMQDIFIPLGVEMRLAPTAGDAQAALLEGAKLLWLESPSNPTMDVCDIAALSKVAHEAGALVGVDNTTATPLGQSPLALGADFSVSSDTKMIGGHGDLLAGHVAVREGATDASGMNLYDRLAKVRTRSGAILGPMEAWLLLRSIASLPLRLERSCENALALAEFLGTRGEVSAVMYPGLPSALGHAVARRQMRSFGPVLSFVLKDQAKADDFLSRAQLITDATSFGAIHTTAERRKRWGHDNIPDGLIRLSAGCEAIEDLVDDIAQALA